jgi:uncharacterized membrane protein (GlpM family)
MAFEPAFFLELALKMAMTAAIVVTASVLVERSGPFVGALIAALPTAAGAVYIILAIEHPPAFIAASAVGSMVSNAAVAVFALTYAALAQRRGLALSLGGAFAVWFAAAALLHLLPWNATAALVLNMVVLSLTAWAGSRFQTDGPPPKPEPRRGDLAWRALTVAVCVAIVTVASHRIGSFASGMFAVFPVAMGSFFIILHPRIGGPAAASVAAHVQAPLFGLVLGFLTVHDLAGTIGVWWSYAAGLAVGVAWNALLWRIKRRQAAAAAASRSG